MEQFMVNIEGVVEAEDMPAAVRKLAAHFLNVADAWDADEVNWDSFPSTFAAPASIEIRRI